MMGVAGGFSIEQAARDLQSRRTPHRALIEIQEIVSGRIVGCRTDVFHAVQDISPDRNVVDTDCDMEAILAAVDHISDLLAR